MARKFDPEEAFASYVAAGDRRSYAALAKQYHVAKRSIAECARRHDWPARLAKIEAEAQAKSDKRMSDTRAETRERHLKLLRAVESRAVQALQAHALDSAMEGVRALDASIKLQRVILGEPNERIGFSIEEITRREVESFLAAEDDDG